MSTIRRFHIHCKLAAIKPAFEPHNSRPGVRNFDDNFEVKKKTQHVKIWDQKGISKHEFFIRKYGQITPENRKRLDDKVLRQKSFREQRETHMYREKPYRFTKEKLKLNPLCEYIYGTHAVISALSAAKRESFSTLYTHSPKEHTDRILKLAKKFGIRVVEKKSKGELNTLSSNGVHNGVVLETKPLLIPEIVSLNCIEDEYTGEYKITLNDDLDHELSKVSKFVTRFLEPEHKKFPFGIFVDGITDPQNLGSIVRTAFYLGADFMVIPESECARLGPVAAKAAAGALDLLDIYKSTSPLEFIDSAKNSGWTIVTTSAKEVEEDLGNTRSKHRPHFYNKYVEPSELPRMMNLAPMIMVLGSEGAGVRTNIKLKSNFLVGWKKGRRADNLIDSVNVGVAAGLMIAKCLE